jgi:hypothetical protein
VFTKKTSGPIIFDIDNYLDHASGIVPMIFDMLESLDNNNMSNAAMILWALWWRRNQKCWNDVLPTVYDVTRRENESLQDWKGARRHNAVAL